MDVINIITRHCMQGSGSSDFPIGVDKDNDFYVLSSMDLKLVQLPGNIKSLTINRKLNVCILIFMM